MPPSKRDAPRGAWSRPSWLMPATTHDRGSAISDTACPTTAAPSGIVISNAIVSPAPSPRTIGDAPPRTRSPSRARATRISVSLRTSEMFEATYASIRRVAHAHR